MHIHIVFIMAVLLLVPKEPRAQVAITNPGFEVYSTCPTDISQIGLAVGWFQAVMHPDYYNCSFTSYFGTPSLGSGVESAGFAGFLTSHEALGAAEAIGQELNEPLLPGIDYIFSFMGMIPTSGGYTNNCGGVEVLGFKNAIPEATSYIHASQLSGAISLGISSSITTASWQPYQFGLQISDTVNFIAVTIEAAPFCQQYIFVDNLSISPDHTTSMADADSEQGSCSWSITDDRLIISSTHRMNDLYMSDMSGRIMHRARPGSDRVELPKPPSGIYIISMSTAAGPMQIRALSVH